MRFVTESGHPAHDHGYATERATAASRKQDGCTLSPTARQKLDLYNGKLTTLVLPLPERLADPRLRTSVAAYLRAHSLTVIAVGCMM